MVDNREVHIYALKHPDTLEVRYAGGDGCIGFIHNSEAIEKIRQSKIGTKHSIEFKEAMSKRLKGVPLSEEHKSKIGLANKGRRASETTRVRNPKEKEVNLLNFGGLRENLLKI